MSVGEVCNEPNRAFAAWKYLSARSILADPVGGDGRLSRSSGIVPSCCENGDVQQAKAHANS